MQRHRLMQSIPLRLLGRRDGAPLQAPDAPEEGEEGEHDEPPAHAEDDEGVLVHQKGNQRPAKTPELCRCAPNRSRARNENCVRPPSGTRPPSSTPCDTLPVPATVLR